MAKSNQTMKVQKAIVDANKFSAGYYGVNGIYKSKIDVINDYIRDQKFINLKIINLEKCSSLLRRNNTVKYLELRDTTDVGNNFLKDNKVLESLKAPKLKKIGNDCLLENLVLKEISLPLLESVGNNFLKNNLILSKLCTPNLKNIGDYFLFKNKGLKKVVLNNLEIAGRFVFTCNEDIKYFEARKLKKVGAVFLYNNKKLTNKTLLIDNLKTTGGDFLGTNENVVIFEYRQHGRRIIKPKNVKNVKKISESQRRKKTLEQIEMSISPHRKYRNK
ncbi:MAG TPA: hypothetical protein PK495_08375 [Bacteroidales bacterium]|nr:hypothetical protein [Bacteroidales bacterium]